MSGTKVFKQFTVTLSDADIEPGQLKLRMHTIKEGLASVFAKSGELAVTRSQWVELGIEKNFPVLVVEKNEDNNTVTLCLFGDDLTLSKIENSEVQKLIYLFVFGSLREDASLVESIQKTESAPVTTVDFKSEELTVSLNNFRLAVDNAKFSLSIELDESSNTYTVSVNGKFEDEKSRKAFESFIQRKLFGAMKNRKYPHDNSSVNFSYADNASAAMSKGAVVDISMVVSLPVSRVLEKNHTRINKKAIDILKDNGCKSSDEFLQKKIGENFDVNNQDGLSADVLKEGACEVEYAIGCLNYALTQPGANYDEIFPLAIEARDEAIQKIFGAISTLVLPVDLPIASKNTAGRLMSFGAKKTGLSQILVDIAKIIGSDKYSENKVSPDNSPLVGEQDMEVKLYNVRALMHKIVASKQNYVGRAEMESACEVLNKLNLLATKRLPSRQAIINRSKKK